MDDAGFWLGLGGLGVAILFGVLTVSTYDAKSRPTAEMKAERDAREQGEELQRRLVEATERSLHASGAADVVAAFGGSGPEGSERRTRVNVRLTNGRTAAAKDVDVWFDGPLTARVNAPLLLGETEQVDLLVPWHGDAIDGLVVTVRWTDERGRHTRPV